MQDLKQALTQSEIFGEELKRLAKDVTKKDREAFLEESEFSNSTLSNYLKGKVSDNDTAVLVINYFTQRIQDRFNNTGINQD